MDSDNEDYFFDDSDIEDEDDAFDIDFDLTKSNKVQTEPSDIDDEKDYNYKVLEPGEVVKHMSDRIREVNVILQLPSTFTRVLLNNFKWDKDKLMELFYDGDEDKLFSDVKILLPFRNQITSANEPSKNSSNSKVKRSAKECEICFLPVSTKMMMGVQCGHTFCDSCWDRYLTTKIMDEGSVEIIKCAAHGCNSLVDDETVMKFVKDPNVKSKYQHLITKSFVECNKLLHWCTEPNCNYVIEVQYFDAKPVTCKCSKVFCFACGENYHDPVHCNWLKSWKKKCEDDSETAHWILANTKDCPKCHKSIEKNGGCNRILCWKCKFQFCWLCMGPWEVHGYNPCNKYNEQAIKDALNAQDRSKAVLDRYLFYYNRYNNHMNSLKLEHRLYLRVGTKMKEMQEHNMSWVDVQFLKKAVDVLCQCRQTLTYTYVFAFYLEKNNQCIIFEDNQKDLENATEQLSGYLEHDLIDMTTEMFVDTMLKVNDKLRYCENRRNVLIDHVHDGNANGIWLCRDIDV